MRVAMCVHTFPILSETFILSQITGLIKRGHQVEILAFQLGDTTTMHSDVTAYRLLDRMAHWPTTKTDRRSYDIIHCHFGPIGLHGALLRGAGLLQGRLITTFYGYDATRVPQESGPHVYRWLFRLGDLHIAISDYLRTRVVALGCPTDKLIKLPIGLDMAKYSFRPRLMDSAGPVRLLTVARLVEKKGLEYSIRAVAEVAKRHPNVLYQIVGDGPLRGVLEQLIEELGLVDKVHLVGWRTQDEVRVLYEEAHIFILASVTASDGNQEGQALVLQEAQAAGLPVISTLHNGIPESVLNGQSGFLVPERDVGILATKLEYLLDHPDVWSTMGQVGRTFVEERYNVERLNDRLVEIYQQLLVAQREN